MAYAEFFMTTACATTSLTMFGTYGPWMELPDAFPPILWIDTSSTTQRVLNSGLWITGGTSIGGGGAGAASANCPMYLNFHVKLDNYEPGTRWFMPSDCFTRTADSGLGIGIRNTETATGGIRAWKLYYRAVGEGPDPVRMV